MASLQASAKSKVHKPIAGPSLYDRGIKASPLMGRAFTPEENGLDPGEWGNMALLLRDLKQRGIQVQETDRRNVPPEAIMHDRGAPIPAFVISPRSEWGVAQTLKLLKDFKLYNQLFVSVKSGGHGYFNGASCSGVMVNLGGMTGRRVADNMLFLEPGCVLGQIVHSLARHRKAVPHGDCFGVGAGGHFLTAGWDLILARRYGLGCQSVIGGRVVLWDGSIVDVDEKNHPGLLHAMRGGAAAGAGVVTEIRLRLIDEPVLVTWRFTRINRGQLATCVANNAFANAFNLPRDVSVSFRIHFELDQLEPVCSFNIASLLTADETIHCLNQHLGAEITSLVADPSMWNEKPLADLRMLPASEFLAANPEMLSEVSSTALHEDPLVYWKQASSSREMARSFFTSISHWVVQRCETMLLKLYDAFQSVQTEPARLRMYALIIQGGGRISELQQDCCMPLGQALARFELHWDNPDKEERWCRYFTDNISSIIQSQEDTGPGRPYRGDIWREDQALDDSLDKILQEYDRRFM
ncbi:hypothetical protein BGZ60DRAFT_421700 [Tricladium varicosporioides]|nr:hypothetical protein BGZ60DRAFT_421700 [Hymenoscyphus varicosporioides]